jgi:hypothetical protein
MWLEKPDFHNRRSLTCGFDENLQCCLKGSIFICALSPAYQAVAHYTHPFRRSLTCGYGNQALTG